jgi:hypothetical protein
VDGPTCGPPPARDVRANRSGSWSRFVDGLADGAAAGIEGTLYRAGMLTAFIHLDPALATAATPAAGTVAGQPDPGGDGLILERSDWKCLPLITAASSG